MSYLKYNGGKKGHKQSWEGVTYYFRRNEICPKDIPTDFVNILMATFPEQYEVKSKYDLEEQEAKKFASVQTVNKSETVNVEVDIPVKEEIKEEFVIKRKPGRPPRN